MVLIPRLVGIEWIGHARRKRLVVGLFGHQLGFVASWFFWDEGLLGLTSKSLLPIPQPSARSENSCWKGGWSRFDMDRRFSLSHFWRKGLWDVCSSISIRHRAMMPWALRGALLVGVAVANPSQVVAQTSALPVFPGAVGFGTTTVAGSGRGTSPAKTTIIKVTNLNDSGTGSLRACLTASGPRTCVFEVGGYINLLTKITIKTPNVSVFGQTAPYPGIQVRDGSIVVQADDVLIQHIASRPGDRNLPTDGGTGVKASDRDAFGIWGNTSSDPVERIVLDHVSATWGMDESISTYTGANGTARRDHAYTQCDAL